MFGNALDAKPTSIRTLVCLEVLEQQKFLNIYPINTKMLFETT